MEIARMNGLLVTAVVGLVALAGWSAGRYMVSTTGSTRVKILHTEHPTSFAVEGEANMPAKALEVSELDGWVRVIDHELCVTCYNLPGEGVSCLHACR